MLELAARMVTVAQAHSELHRRMTSEKLNQANRPFDDSQLQVSTKGRKTEASLRLPAQLPISHEKLDTIEDEIEVTSLTPNLLTSSREILCSCVACSRLLSRDYVVAQDSNGASDSHFPID